MRTPTHHESVELEAMTLEQKLCKYWSQNTAAIGRGQLKPYGRQYLADLPISEDSHFRAFYWKGKVCMALGRRNGSRTSKRGKGFQPYAVRLFATSSRPVTGFQECRIGGTFFSCCGAAWKSLV